MSVTGKDKKNKSITNISTGRKAVYMAAFLVIAILAASAVLAVSYVVYNLTWDDDEVDKRTGSFRDTVNFLRSKSIENMNLIDEDLITDARLSASSISEQDGEPEIGSAYGGYVVRVTGNTPEDPVIVPDDYDGENLTGDLFSSSNGICDLLQSLMAYARIDDDYYYIEFSDSAASYESADDLDFQEALDNYAAATGCDYLYTVNLGDEATAAGDDQWTVLAGTGDFAEISDLAELGLTAENMEKSGQEFGEAVTIDGRNYNIYSRTYQDDSQMVIMLQSTTAEKIEAMEELVSFIMLTILIIIPLAVWILSSIDALVKGRIREEDRERYAPAAFSSRVALCILAGTLVVGIASALTQSVIELFYESTVATRALKQFELRMQGDKARTDRIWEASQKRYIGNAKLLARLLDSNRNLQNKEWLKEASDIMDADYITIYDTDGHEVISSARYRGLDLGEDSDSATYDFRRLLRGVKEISHNNVTDEITGLTRDYHGISLIYLGNDESYGALLIAVSPDEEDEIKFSDAGVLAESLAPEGGVIFGVDPETEKVSFSSDPKLMGCDAKLFGLSKEELHGGYMGFIHIDGDTYYVHSAEYDGTICCYAYLRSYMLWYTLRYAVTAAILFAVIAGLTTLFLMRGYREAYESEFGMIGEETTGGAAYGISSKDEVSEDGAERSAASEDNKADPNLRKTAGIRSEDGSAGNKSDGRKHEGGFEAYFASSSNPVRSAINSAIVLAVLVTGLITVISAHTNTRLGEIQGVVDYISMGEWPHGINLFAIAAAFFAISRLVLVLAVISLAAVIAEKILDRKGRTISALITDGLRYLALFICLFKILGYFGVDIRTMLASVGLVGLAISLAARDMLSDVIAGITILATGMYQVGDIIEISGFQGEVVNIGIRRTEVLGSGGNVKSYRNSQIDDIVNYSRMNSRYMMLVTIPNTYPVEEIEKLLNRELPDVGRKYKKILSGPRYSGIDSFTSEATTYIITTECSREDYSDVVRTVNRELRLILAGNNIDMAPENLSC